MMTYTGWTDMKNTYEITKWRRQMWMVYIGSKVCYLGWGASGVGWTTRLSQLLPWMEASLMTMAGEVYSFLHDHAHVHEPAVVGEIHELHGQPIFPYKILPPFFLSSLLFFLTIVCGCCVDVVLLLLCFCFFFFLFFLLSFLFFLLSFFFFSDVLNALNYVLEANYETLISNSTPL